MRERGVDAVTVQDITEEADIGHGTFYLHFKSKAEVLRPVIDRLADRIHEEVDRVTKGQRDPAHRLAAGVRIALRAIVSDPLWNWYVFQSGTHFRRLAEGLGAPPVEDVNLGVDQGRFQVGDLRATWSFIDGAMIGVLTAWGQGSVGEDAAETTAELVLRTLGVPPDEAATIARVPLDLA